MHWIEDSLSMAAVLAEARLCKTEGCPMMHQSASLSMRRKKVGDENGP